MFAFQSKEKIGGSLEELSSKSAAKNRPFSGGFSNSELIQLLSGSLPDASKVSNTDSSQNISGIPDGLKAKYEQRSGVSMDDVSVHYNSDKPVQYGALAYTQGNDVYLGPGQEQHLGHELGHVIQQKQGRVPVTGSVGGAPLNDDPALEQEADSFLSGNSPVQHITAGSPPDSGAPIQRLRINLSGDGKNGDPTIRHLQYYNIPTGGDRLAVPNSNHEEVKKTVAAFQDELGTNEDIVFEGHGVLLCPEGPTIALQNFFAKELAKMAADIKKPDNWKGKIILFGCCAGDIAPQVAEEYYKITKTSVTVVGPKEEIIMASHPLYPPQSLFGFRDLQKQAALGRDSNYLFLRQLFPLVAKGLRSIPTFFEELSADLLRTPQEDTLAALVVYQKHLIPNSKAIAEKLHDAPDGFWERKDYQSFIHPLQILLTAFHCIRRHCQTLNEKVQLPETDDQELLFHLKKLSGLAKIAAKLYLEISKEMKSEYFQASATVFKSILDFDDKEMMISATYTAEDDDIAFSLAQQMALFKDYNQNNHNSLFSANLFDLPNLFDLHNPPAKWSDLFQPPDTK